MFKLNISLPFLLLDKLMEFTRLDFSLQLLMGVNLYCQYLYVEKSLFVVCIGKHGDNTIIKIIKDLLTIYQILQVNPVTTKKIQKSMSIMVRELFKSTFCQHFQKIRSMLGDQFYKIDHNLNIQISYYYKQNQTIFHNNQMQIQSINPQSPNILIDTIRYKLWSINKLPLQDIYQSLLYLVPQRSIDTFIPLIRECISVTKRDHYIIKYLHLFDMLLSRQVFNRLLHGCLVEFYSKIVSHLNRQNLKAEIEQCKIMRKYWARRIHYKMYEDMKAETYRMTSIDVDNILSVEAIQNILHYYVDVIRMPPHQLHYYLPQTNRIGSAYYQSTLSETLNKPSDKYNDKYTPQYRKVAFPVSKNVTSTKNVFNPSNNIPNDYVNSNDLNNNLYNSTPSQSYDSVSKSRCQSEQTNLGDNLQVLRKVQCLNNHDVRYFNPILKTFSNTKKLDCQNELINYTQKTLLKEKIVKLSEEQSKYKNQQVYALSILDKLNSLNCHECKKCGKRFQTKQSYQEHADWHVTSRLKQLEIQEANKFGSNINIKKTSSISSKVWIAQAQQGEDIQVDFLQGDQAKLKQQICYICGQKFEQICKGQQWVLRNAIKAVFSKSSENEKQCWMIHRQCSKIAFESGLKSEVR